MNIKKAKEQIKNAMTAYFTKDEFGGYVIPPERQRPVFLIGPPGIGKTAIMEQIAEELGVGLVSYSMTHHTRQSALGLPFIEKKIYGGVEYSVSEYTMSEIIASVYDFIEKTGLSEGILFLDEINCVSETLAPAMLQFLQYKTFGRHRVPEGWIVVTAGNPPEYHASVRDFDVVTWDRLKRVDVEPDYAVWKEYALKKQTHPSVLTYLEVKKENFYQVETTVDGKSFVTARGWSDLSDMLRLYEKNGLAVDEDLVGQYLQNKKIARDFSIYYDLYNKYKSDYQTGKILSGEADESIKDRARHAKFDERLSLIGLLLDEISSDFKDVFTSEKLLENLILVLKELQTELLFPGISPEDCLTKKIKAKEEELSRRKEAKTISKDEEYAVLKTLEVLKEEERMLKEKSPADGTKAFALIKKDFAALTQKLSGLSEETKKKLSNLFDFVKEAFGEGQEMLILVTELTTNPYSSYFISRYGSEEYFANSKELLFFERQKDIISRIDELDL